METILSEEILKQYQRLCQKADYLLEEQEFQTAIDCYKEALSLLPENNIWSCSSYAYTGIGEAYQSLNNYQQALHAFLNSYLL